jgi:hypothetical protein
LSTWLGERVGYRPWLNGTYGRRDGLFLDVGDEGREAYRERNLSQLGTIVACTLSS